MLKMFMRTTCVEPLTMEYSVIMRLFFFLCAHSLVNRAGTHPWMVASLTVAQREHELRVSDIERCHQHKASFILFFCDSLGRLLSLVVSVGVETQELID